MRQIALAGLAAAGLLSGTLLGSPAARAADYGYDADDAPETVVTRRTVVERRVVLPPREIVREIVVERPAPPPRIVREVIEEPPVVFRPRPVIRDVVVEREGVYGPRRFGPRPVGYGDGPAYDPYD